MTEWPDKLFDLIFFPSMDKKLNDLAELAEDEEWEYQEVSNDSRHKPILFNYLYLA
jgi:hypothetical protein